MKIILGNNPSKVHSTIEKRRNHWCSCCDYDYKYQEISKQIEDIKPLIEKPNENLPHKDHPIEEQAHDGHQKIIVVHNGAFHADDALAVAFLLNTEEFKDAKVVRTSNEKEIEKADVVCDVGCVYDHEKRRYDHHQPDFNQTFKNCPVLCSSCGLVYIHFGRKIIKNILRRNGRTPGKSVERLYNKMYHSFVKEIDAIDNGIRLNTEPYSIQTGISARIHHLNKHVKNPGCSKDECFMEAVHLIENEFEENLLLCYDEQREIDYSKPIVREAYESRFDIDESGHIVLLEENCNFNSNLRDLERKEARKSNNIAPKVFYVLYPSKGQWHCTAINEEDGRLRKPLPCKGLRDEELSNSCGISGGIFVHRCGFMAMFNKRQNIIKFAQYALQAEEEPQVQTESEDQN